MSRDEGYVGFLLGISKMRELLTEKDKEIEKLKAEIEQLTEELEELRGMVKNLPAL